LFFLSIIPIVLFLLLDSSFSSTALFKITPVSYGDILNSLDISR
jgi:hypothetical protein